MAKGKLKKIIWTVVAIFVGLIVLAGIFGNMPSEQENNVQTSDNCKVTFEKIDEKYLDLPVKGQVIVKFLSKTSGECDFQDIAKAGAEFLKKQLNVYKNKKFNATYHPRPTNVYLYVYDNEEYANKRTAAWVARAEWNEVMNEDMVYQQDKTIYDLEVQDYKYYKQVLEEYGSWNNFVKKVLKKIRPQLCKYPPDASRIDPEKLGVDLKDYEKVYLKAFIIYKVGDKKYVDASTKPDPIEDDETVWWYDGINIEKRTEHKTTFTPIPIIEIDCSDF